MTNLAVEKRSGDSASRSRARRSAIATCSRCWSSNGWLWGGESSGHLLCLDKHTTGDGIVSALQVLSALRRSGRTLAELTTAVRLYPQTMINVKIGKGFDWERHAPLIEARQSVDGRPRPQRPHPDPAVRHRTAAARDGRGGVRVGRDPAAKRLVASLESGRRETR